MKLLRANKSMLERYAPYLTPTDIVLPHRLLSILNSGLVIKDGCVLFKDLLSECHTTSRDNFSDMTGYECFVNHIHLNGRNFIKMIKTGVSFLAKVSIVYKKSGTNVPLVGIISLIETDVSGITVRFHLNRLNEVWLADDIEAYEEECVAEFEL